MAEHKKYDVKERLEEYRCHVTEMSRETSYDFCYGYFQTHRHRLTENMEMSCLHLWSYLASWGMLRGSSVLLNDYNMKVLKDIIEYLDTLTEEEWQLDIPDCEKREVCERIVEIYNEISSRIEKIDVTATVTLVTKIMMGTLGCVPAIDDYFARAFRVEFNDNMPLYAFRRFTSQVLECFYEFYEANKNEFDSIKYPVHGFDWKEIDDVFYKKAKLLDMYGWQTGNR